MRTMKYRRTRDVELAVDLGQRAVRAVRIRSGRQTKVLATLFERRPESVPSDDPVATGRWLRAALQSGGLGSGAAVFALDRDIVSIKRLELPTADPDELPEMVRMAIERDLPIEAADAVIDFMPIEHSTTSTVVQAVAVPRREIENIEKVAQAAGLVVASITLRCLGAAALAETIVQGEDGILVVDVTGEGLEIALSRHGELLFSRGVSMVGPNGSPPDAEQLTVETRRSWLSYRVSRGEAEAPQVIVLGGAKSDSLVERIAEGTSLSVQPFTAGEVFKPAKNMTGAWPLVGLLSASDTMEPINLAAPRTAPDRAARARQRILAFVGGMIVVAGIGWSIGSAQFRALETTADDLLSKANGARGEFYRFKRDQLRAKHLEEWRSLRPDWLEHLLAVTSPHLNEETVVLDQFGGAILAEPTTYNSAGEWETIASTRISVEGKAESREIAFQLRDDLVGDPRYTLRTTGADAEGSGKRGFPFRFAIKSELLDPTAVITIDASEGGDEP